GKALPQLLARFDGSVDELGRFASGTQHSCAGVCIALIRSLRRTTSAASLLRKARRRDRGRRAGNSTDPAARCRTMARIFEFLRKLSWGLAPALLVACGGAAGVWLYAIGFQGDVESYALPMVSGEGPAAKSGTKAESVAVDGAYLFATVNNLAGVAQFALPLVNGEKPAVTLQVSSGGAIAAGKGFLYVGSSGSPGSVLAYTTPLKRGEPPSATISAGVHLPAALAADGTHLY